MVRPVPARGSPAVAAGVAALALVVFVVVMIASESVLVLVVGLLLAAVSIGAASFALSPAVGQPDAAERAPQADVTRC